MSGIATLPGTKKCEADFSRFRQIRQKFLAFSQFRKCTIANMVRRRINLIKFYKVLYLFGQQLSNSFDLREFCLMMKIKFEKNIRGIFFVIIL